MWLNSLGDKVPLIVDGGQSQVGIESTVLDMTVSPPKILHRDDPGAANRGGERNGCAGGASSAGSVLKSPGQLAKHYSPRARLRSYHGTPTRNLPERAEKIGYGLWEDLHHRTHANSVLESGSAE